MVTIRGTNTHLEHKSTIILFHSRKQYNTMFECVFTYSILYKWSSSSRYRAVHNDVVQATTHFSAGIQFLYIRSMREYEKNAKSKPITIYHGFVSHFPIHKRHNIVLDSSLCGYNISGESKIVI